MSVADIDARGLLRKLEKLGGKNLGRTIGIALGRAGKNVRQSAQLRIREVWDMRAADLKSAIELRTPRATEAPLGGRLAGQYVELIGRGSPVTVRDTRVRLQGNRPRATFPGRMTAAGAEFRIRKGRAFRLYTARGRKAFIIGQRPSFTRLGRNGRRGKVARGRFVPLPKYSGTVFVRTQSGIRPVHGPSVAQRFAGGDVQRLVRSVWQEKFPQRLREILNNEIRKLNAQA